MLRKKVDTTFFIAVLYQITSKLSYHSVDKEPDAMEIRNCFDFILACTPILYLNRKLNKVQHYLFAFKILMKNNFYTLIMKEELLI